MDLVNDVKFFVKKNGPELMAVGGAIAAVGAIVFAIKGTLKVNTILEEHKETIEKIHEVRDDESLDDEYTDEDYKKDLTAAHIQTGFKLAKNYAPTILLGGVSVFLTLGATNILHKRNAALGAAYATIATTFSEYRNRVSERFGNDVEDEIYHNYITKEIEETIVDDKGKEKKVKTKIKEYQGKPGLYSFVFDDSNIYWRIWGGDSGDDRERILWQLRSIERWANTLLASKRMVFLNEVLEALGLEKTQEGQCVGWIYDGDGDNYISFGIGKDRINEEHFIKGNTFIWLDFNVDGPILNELPTASN